MMQRDSLDDFCDRDCGRDRAPGTWLHCVVLAPRLTCSCAPASTAPLLAAAGAAALSDFVGRSGWGAAAGGLAGRSTPPGSAAAGQRRQNCVPQRCSCAWRVSAALCTAAVGSCGLFQIWANAKCEEASAHLWLAAASTTSRAAGRSIGPSAQPGAHSAAHELPLPTPVPTCAVAVACIPISCIPASRECFAHSQAAPAPLAAGTCADTSRGHTSDGPVR